VSADDAHRATRERRWPFARRQEHGAGRLRDAKHSAASEQERLIVARLADLRDMDVREVMTPRVDVVALTIPVTGDAVARAVRESGHSCFPVVHDDLDDLVGILFVNDLFRAGRRPGPGESSEPTPLDISRRLRQPYLVPESRRILDALSEMRQQRRAFAIVVDEHGGVAGVLTVKDLLEPLVGDLYDEFDPEEEPEIVRVDANRWLIDGRTSVDDVREKLAIEIPDGEYVTLGGFLFEGFGHIPEEGESLAAGDWDLRVAEMDKRRIARVLARQRTTAPGPAADAAGGPPPEGRRAAETPRNTADRLG
jgi:CBS domain containing-hemolysin-like protein